MSALYMSRQDNCVVICILDNTYFSEIFCIFSVHCNNNLKRALFVPPSLLGVLVV